MGKERRRQERHESYLFVEFEPLSAMESLGRGVVIDVSLSGFAVETRDPLPVNTEIFCHLEIPMTLRAKAVRHMSAATGTQGHRYGLQFVGPALMDKFVLRRLLKGNLKTRKVVRRVE